LLYDRSVMRRRIAFPVFLAALGLIWASAHAVAHDVVTRPATGSHHGAGHGPVERYLAFLPTSLALCLALALAVVAGAGLGRRWTRRGPSVWLFGAVPLLGFAADTLIELPVEGHATWSGTAVLVLELTPALLVGLLVQIPFALAALGLATGILRLAEGLARALCTPRTRAVLAIAGPAAPELEARPGALALAGSHRSRAPPSR
jgi:hypothetical protein